MSHQISLEQAIEMTTSFRENKELILDAQYQGLGLLPLSETFDRTAIDILLAQSDCEKVRLYYGMDTSQKLHAIIVGVDSNDEDILPETDHLIIETGVRCPPQCPPVSPLNL
jgi:hypothetical protein